MKEHFLWVDKYAPKSIEDVIIPEETKKLFRGFIKKKNVPNLILSGTPGIGKTTVAKVVLDTLKCDYIMINGSLDGNIDVLRNQILQFASTVSFSGGRKYVIFDEADHLNPNSTQLALRGFMNTFAKNCGFIFTCNYKNKIIEPLHSRCTTIDFKIPKKDIPVLATQFMKRMEEILVLEKIEYNKQVVAKLIEIHFPDWRRVINDIQRYSASGTIDTGILAQLADENIVDLIEYLKNKNYNEIRKWVKNNIDTDVNELFTIFYEKASSYFIPNAIPELVVICARYQYQNAFSANSELNFMAFLMEVMLMDGIK